MQGCLTEHTLHLFFQHVLLIYNQKQFINFREIDCAMSKTIVLCSFLLLAALLPAQTTPSALRDSLEQAAKQASEDSVKAEIYSQLFTSSYRQDAAAAAAYLEQQATFADRVDCPCCYGKLLGNEGIFLKSKGEFPEAESKHLEAIRTFEGHGCPEGNQARSYINLGEIYMQLGQLEKAAIYLAKARKSAFNSDEPTMVLASLVNLGIVYFKLEDYDQAEQYYREALVRGAETASPSQVAAISLNIGNLLTIKEDHAGALEFYLSAVRIGEENRDSVHLPSRYVNAGISLSLQNKSQQAIAYLEKALEMSQATGNKQGEALAHSNIASILARQGAYTQAIRHTEEAIAYYEATGAATELLIAYDNLADYYAGSQDYRRAFEVYKSYAHLLDSTSKDRSSQQLATQLAAFEATRLQSENKIVRDSLTIAQQAGQLKDLRISRYNVLLAALAAAIPLLALLTYLLLRASKLRQRLEIAELEQTALRARMNPHFLFNALNSIQNAILNRDKMVAYEYHSKFSELIRMVLVHSAKKTVSLSEEIAALKLYLELERFRTGDKFSFLIQVGADIQPEEQRIPSLLLQPFVENAIWHGVLNKDSPGTIRIEISGENEFLLATIEDDGVGRAAAARLRQLHKPGHQGIATQVAQSRMELYRRQFGDKISLKIIDLETKGIPAGTRIELSIPIQLNA